MKYWWVNQNQTFRHEFDGGYLWSPKTKQGGTRNPFYEFMREVSPGDMVFSFADTFIKAFGFANSYAYEAPKPEEFGGAGRNWSHIGWRVDVRFQHAPAPVRPADRMDEIRPLLPPRYSPLLSDGRGSQSIYLTVLPPELGLLLADMLGGEIGALARSEAVGERSVTEVIPEQVLWEEHLRQSIESDTRLSSTQREALVLARRGQGLFRNRVSKLERRCRVTGVDRSEFLRASHCKPWRDATNDERLDPNNGLMLTPTIDHLFDKGFISFQASGEILISPVAHRLSLQRMGIDVGGQMNVGKFRPEQARYLEYHRDAVFLRARVG